MTSPRLRARPAWFCIKPIVAGFVYGRDIGTHRASAESEFPLTRGRPQATAGPPAPAAENLHEAHPQAREPTTLYHKGSMARSSYSAGKRQRELEKQRKKKRKADRQAQNRASGSGTIQVTTVDEIQGGLLSIEEVVANVHTGPAAVAPVGGRSSGGVPTRLFVGSLDWAVNTDMLRKAFEAMGDVIDAAVVLDRDTGDSRGFGFVTMANHREAAKAIEELNGRELEGRALVVRQATERRR